MADFRVQQVAVVAGGFLPALELLPRHRIVVSDIFHRKAISRALEAFMKAFMAQFFDPAHVFAVFLGQTMKVRVEFQGCQPVIPTVFIDQLAQLEFESAFTSLPGEISSVRTTSESCCGRFGIRPVF